jgi:pyruvate formate lyase activating enzyme
MQGIEPLFFHARGASLVCELCPRSCVIRPGGAGACGARRNARGRPELPAAGLVTALARDPVEKKPLYHFRPGSTVVSAGFLYCNLCCPFCQNWQLSHPESAEDRAARGRFLTPEALVKLVDDDNTRLGAEPQIAYTYSEPLVHIEYLLACMQAARERGMANILVTNGCVQEEPAARVLALTDAVNIDLKSFSAGIYARTLGGDLEAVKRFIRGAAAAGVHTEVTTLIVPGLSGGAAEIDAMAAFLAEAGAANGSRGPIPWHITAYHPAWNYQAPPTAPALVRALAQRAREKLPCVYEGNISPM